MSRRRLVVVTAALLVGVLVGGAAVLVHKALFGPKTITAYFSTTTGIYPGDEVRVSGVTVGGIDAITPDGAQARMTMHVDRGVPIPADAKAIIVAQNLVAARYVQLTPAYRDQGPTMTDGAVIPQERTAVPVEWDQVKDQLTRLATELGPAANISGTSLSNFIDSATTALGADNGAKLRRTLNQLSAVGRVFAQGSGNLVDIIKNLQTFIAALRDSNQQIVAFQGRLATLTSTIDGSRSDLDAALTNISDVVGTVQRFVKEVRDPAAEQVQRMADVTQNLVDHRKDLEQILHVAPTAIANAYNMFDPRTGGASGVFTVNNFNNPVAFLCGEIAAQENVTAVQTGKLCSQYLGPGLRQLNFNYLPFPFNPAITSAPRASDLIYSDPDLAPVGPGPAPEPPIEASTPPAVSAYTGTGDVAPPPGYGAAPPPPATQPTPSLSDLLMPPSSPPPGQAPPSGGGAEQP